MFRKNDIVKHPVKHEWGLGKVLDDTRDDKTRVKFADAGEKIIAGQYVTLLPVKKEEIEAFVSPVNTNKKRPSQQRQIALSEKDLDAALEEKFKQSDEFAQWFLSKSKFAEETASYVWSRSDHPWGRFTISVKNKDTGEMEEIVRDSETDVLVVYETLSGKRFAFHIENKLGGGAFTDYQPEIYHQRAEAWLEKERFGSYTDFETVLVAPIEFYERNLERAKQFDLYISHEEILDYIPEFSRLDIIASADTKCSIHT